MRLETYAGESPPELARDVFGAWERLRLLYNFLLIIEVVVLDASSLADRSYWKFLLIGAAIANVCYSIGPTMEGYLSLLGLERRSIRAMLFVGGTLLACLLTFAAIFSRHLEDFD